MKQKESNLYLAQPIWIFWIALLLALTPLYAQDQLRLRYAQALEKSGNYADALSIYQDLYRSGNRSHEVINGSVKAYRELKQNPALENFLNEVIKQFPSNIHYRIAYGTSLYLNNKDNEAYQVWDEVCAAQPADIMNFRFTASELIELRLYSKAIEIYHNAIKTFDKQEMLYRDIAALYRALLDYENTVESLLQFYSFFPNQIGYIRSQIIAMSRDDEAVQRIIRSIEIYMRSHQTESAIEEIIASLYLKNKEFDRSYALYLKLNKQNTAQNYLLRFAREAQAQGAYEYAIEAYRLLIDENPDVNLVQTYRLQLAESYYSSGKLLSATTSSAEGQVRVKNAEEMLLLVSNGSNNPSHTWQAFERLGDIRLEYYNDIDQALQYYLIVQKSKAPFDVLDRIYLKTGNAHILKNDLDAADRQFQQVRTKEQKKIADFNRAEITLFKNYFSRAKMQYENIMAGLAPRDTVANNALSRLMLIEQYAADSLHFSKYCTANLLQRQKKISEAAHELENLFAARRPISPLAGERCAEIYMELKKPDAAQSILNKIVDEYADYRDIDHVYFLLADVHESRQQPELALENYRKILTNFPNSFYFDQARERARLLSNEQNNIKLP